MLGHHESRGYMHVCSPLSPRLFEHSKAVFKGYLDAVEYSMTLKNSANDLSYYCCDRPNMSGKVEAYPHNLVYVMVDSGADARRQASKPLPKTKRDHQAAQVTSKELLRFSSFKSKQLQTRTNSRASTSSKAASFSTQVLI